MAATKFGFLTQPNNTNQGYTLQGGVSTDNSILGVVLPQSSTSFQASPGIQVACLNADGTLDQTATTAVTIAIGTNPTSGSTITGTLVQNAVAGIATFSNLAITLGGNGYTITATGTLTTATSNAFNVVTVARINPAEFVSTPLVATGVANAQGPYRFRAGSALKGVEISASSSNTTDAVQIVITEPGQALTTNTAAKPTTIQGGSAFQLGPLTCPFHLTMDSNEIGGACDIYLYATTNAGAIIANIKRMEIGGR